MKRGPINYRKSPMSEEDRAWFREFERQFHVRTFGEELARVNLDMTIEERREYLAWMREAAKKSRSEGGAA